MDSGKLDRASESGGASRPNQAPDPDRRDFLSTFSTIAMAGGLAAGYGTLAALAVRYVFPTDYETPWLYVAPAAEIGPGESLVFESPVGAKVTIAHRPGGNEAADPAEQFIALSSVCPHLGCRVHWEPHNKRFFCPCHNGVFDPEGRPVSGPPKAAEQELSRYPLKVEGGLLYIAISTRSVGGSAERESPGGTQS
jgi:nitrite reductase/ring-hydroxylating ferredoxin subunit